MASKSHPWRALSIPSLPWANHSLDTKNGSERYPIQWEVEIQYDGWHLDIVVEANLELDVFLPMVIILRKTEINDHQVRAIQENHFRWYRVAVSDPGLNSVSEPTFHCPIIKPQCSMIRSFSRRPSLSSKCAEWVYLHESQIRQAFLPDLSWRMLSIVINSFLLSSELWCWTIRDETKWYKVGERQLTRWVQLSSAAGKMPWYYF